MRTFLALDLPDAQQDALEDLADAVPVGRAVPAENLHLTLAFLDDQPDEVLEALHGKLQGLDFAPVPLVFDGLGSFGGTAPRVLFAGVAANPALSALHGKVLSACRAAGLDLPRRRFRPHVTLARLPPQLRPEGRARLERFVAAHAALHLPAGVSGGITLFRSTLHPGGAIHEELASYPFCAPGAGR